MPMVKFTPSPEQREVVAALSAAKMPLEKIAASIINPRTQRAISVKTLGKLFKDQLDSGVGVIVEAFRGLKAALEAKEPWAIKYALDHVGEFKAKEKEVTTPIKEEIQNINVAFVTAKGRVSELEDIEPTFLAPPPRNLTLAPALPEPPKPAPAPNKYAFEREEPPQEGPRTELDEGLRPGWVMDAPRRPANKKHWLD